MVKGVPAASEEPPLAKPTLAWLHGIRAHDTRSALHYTARGELVYPAAALVVVLGSTPDNAAAASSAPARRMRFYGQHAAAVTAIAMHPDGVTVASASLGAEPAVSVWNPTIYT